MIALVRSLYLLRPERWPRLRFSLRTLLILVTALSVLFAWFVVQLKWKQDRHEARKFLDKLGNETYMATGTPTGYYTFGTAPFPLLFLGERGIGQISLPSKAADRRTELQQLFPEAVLYDVVEPGS